MIVISSNCIFIKICYIQLPVCSYVTIIDTSIQFLLQVIKFLCLPIREREKKKSMVFCCLHWYLNIAFLLVTREGENAWTCTNIRNIFWINWSVLIKTLNCKCLHYYIIYCTEIYAALTFLFCVGFFFSLSLLLISWYDYCIA